MLILRNVSFAWKKIMCLGYVVTAQGIEMDKEKVKSHPGLAYTKIGK